VGYTQMTMVMDDHGDVVLVGELIMARDPEHTLARLTVVAVVAVALLLIGSTPTAEAPGVTSRVNGCATNIDLINSQLELYYANTGEWPATLDVLTADTDYFPNGPPVCPASRLPYRNALTGSNKVDDALHGH
jgi:competence protein ComGC